MNNDNALYITICLAILTAAMLTDLIMTRILIWYYHFGEGNKFFLTQWFTKPDLDPQNPKFPSAAFRAFLDGGYKLALVAIIGWAMNRLGIYNDHFFFIPLALGIPFFVLVYKEIKIYRAQKLAHPGVK